MPNLTAAATNKYVSTLSTLWSGAAPLPPFSSSRLALRSLPLYGCVKQVGVKHDVKHGVKHGVKHKSSNIFVYTTVLFSYKTGSTIRSILFSTIIIY